MLDKFGVDGEPTSPGHKGARGERNSPTVYNAALHLAQFWDGRAADVEEQAKGPVLNPVEMAMTSEAVVVSTIRSIPGYAEPFAKAFPGEESPITYDNIAIAIGAFERTLVTPGRFDAYLKGDGSALTAAEIEGAKVFVQTGCTTCHMGPLLGGQMYQKLGLVKPYDNPDTGRFQVTNNEADKQVFKVPSLRNISKTAPYYHDGHVATLPEAVKLMASHQLGRDLTDEDTSKIVTFLDALTGELPKDRIVAPKLPESGPDTPKPDPS
jgi:cytochrome c peroxidase